MIQLTDKLFAIPVPENTDKFFIEIAHDQETYYLQYCFGEESEIIILDGNYDEVGTVSKDTIDFDVEGYVWNTDEVGITGFKEINDKRFRSLLASKGCNPDEKHLIIEKI